MLFGLDACEVLSFGFSHTDLRIFMLLWNQVFADVSLLGRIVSLRQMRYKFCTNSAFPVTRIFLNLKTLKKKNLQWIRMSIRQF